MHQNEVFLGCRFATPKDAFLVASPHALDMGFLLEPLSVMDLAPAVRWGVAVFPPVPRPADVVDSSLQQKDSCKWVSSRTTTRRRLEKLDLH